MTLIIEVSENGTKNIACYAVRRLTNTDNSKPVGTTNTYEIRKSNLINSWGEPLGCIEHNYDDPVEKIVELTMKKILEGNEPRPKIPNCPWCLKDYGLYKPLSWNQFKEVWVCRSHGSFDETQLKDGV